MKNCYSLQECLLQTNNKSMGDAFLIFFGKNFMNNQRFHYKTGEINALDNFYLPFSNYCLKGDVNCAKTLFLFPKDGEGESSFVVIMGNVDCENLYLLPNTVLFVSGKLKVSNIMYTGGHDTLVFSYGEMDAQVNFAISEDVGLQPYKDLVTGQSKFFRQEEKRHVFSLLKPPVLDTSDWDSFSEVEQNEILQEAGEEEMYEYLFVNGTKLLAYLEEG
ncbi:hypothetical protein [Flagellimonas sp.]|uniref:hypothetical protein n=1 Tax=Flagellimonas sp. TaxID=2058762 RepID=UPI003B5CECEC